MKVVLYLDTSIFGFGIAIRALSSNEETLYKVYKSDRSSANLKLSTLVIEALESVGSSVEDVDSVIVSKGPGSFTGIRVGLSWVQGFCQGLACRKYGVSSLELLARHLSKVESKDKLSVLLANTKKTAFLASLEQDKVDLRFIAEESSKEELEKLSASLYIDNSYDLIDKEFVSKVFSKEDFACAAFEALVSEITPEVLQSMPEDQSLEPLYLRKSSVEEKMQKS